MLIGYARVSTAEQNLNLQLDALRRVGCEKIFQDICSGVIDNRKGLSDALALAKSGDCLVTWKLDRLGRSVVQLVSTVNDLKSKNIDFRSLTESIDTQSPGGKLIFHVFSALAEFERDLIRSRTKAGLEAARSRGIIGGRPKKLNAEKIAMARLLLNSKKTSISSICQTLNVSRATLYRHVRG